jgi:hypothetical protein
MMLEGQLAKKEMGWSSCTSKTASTSEFDERLHRRSSFFDGVHSFPVMSIIGGKFLFCRFSLPLFEDTYGGE